MAVGHLSSDAGTATKTAGISVTRTNYSAAVGDTLIVVAGCDNLSGQTEALPEGTVTDSAGNTWVRLGFLGGPGGGGSSASVAVFGCTVTNALTNGTITVTPNSGVAAKTFVVHKFSGLSLTLRALNSGTSTGGLASSAPVLGDLVVAVTSLEGPTGDTWTPDSDTTNGTWSANTSAGTTGGTAATNITVRTQYKIVTATGTQTYDGSSNPVRDVARMLVVLAPTPPPAGSPEPLVYEPKGAIRFSTGIGRVTATFQDTYAIGEFFDPRLPPVVYMPGVSNSSDEMTSGVLTGIAPIVQAIVDMGFAVVAPTSLFSFGTTPAMTGITNAAAFARNTLGCAAGKFPIIGFSEGACDAMTYAYTNPTQVACVVGVIPIIDLAEIVQQDVLGLASAVLTVWEVGGLPLPAGADPMTPTHQATLAGIPMQHWYSTDDAVSANITAFQAGTGCDVRAVGPYGHTNEAIRRAWPTEIAKFMRKRVPVPYEGDSIT